MDREYLEDYEEKEREDEDRFLKKVQDGTFSFEKDRYPPDERFVNIRRPVAFSASEPPIYRNIWCQIPFCGSLILHLPALPRDRYEEKIFKISDIPKIIDFIKETGKLQVMLNHLPTMYEGLDFLDPFFKELKPPFAAEFPISTFGREKEIRGAYDSFFTLGGVRFFDDLMELRPMTSSQECMIAAEHYADIYVFLRLGHYGVVEEIKSLMIDDPVKAATLLAVCGIFINKPILDPRNDTINSSLELIMSTRYLPLIYRPQEIQFPCEIGKFLVKKMTRAPEGPRACNELIAHYDAYDLQKALESLNEAITTNHPDIVNKSAEEISEILDNVWNDPTIPRRVKGLRFGIPISIAAIGSIAAGPIGGLGGFLAGLGFELLSSSIDIEAEGLSQKLAKLRTKSYQANIYDLKKKYKSLIRHQ